MTVPGGDAVKIRGLSVRKLASELKAKIPLGLVADSTLLRIRSRAKPILMACRPLVRKKSSSAWIEVQWKL